MTSNQAQPSKELSAPKRVTILFLHFFLVVTAYYQVKPASRTLFITYVGSENFPWIWIASALTLGALLPLYSFIIRNYCSDKILSWSGGIFVFFLLLFRLLLVNPNTTSVVCFYIIVDIYSVVLVEQFWSHVSSLHLTSEGKRWYGIIGSGGVLGGIVGSALASTLIDSVGLNTIDLLSVSALFLLFLVFLVPLAKRLGYFNQRVLTDHGDHLTSIGSMKELISNRYIVLITLLILFSQLLEPIIEFQFLSALEQNITELNQRTAYLSNFFIVLGMISLGINLVVTPIILRYLGAIAGLCVQPVLIMLASTVFFISPSLNSAAAMKISDRAFSYSINRAAKELLYIPLVQATIYRVKALIDMFGYRLFKILSSVMIIFITWLSLSEGEALFLTSSTLILCLVWLRIVKLVKVEYAERT